MSNGATQAAAPSPTDIKLVPKLREEANWTDDEIRRWLGARGHSGDAIEQALGRATAVQTGGQELIDQELRQNKADVMRYGVPLAAGLVTANPLAVGAATAAGEFGASRMEGRSGMETALNVGLSGAGAAGLQYGMNWAFPRLQGWLTHKLSTIKLEKLPAEKQRIYRVLSSVGRTPTAGQIAAEGGFLQTMENFARSSWGARGRLRRIDADNINALSDTIVDYLKTQGDVGVNPGIIDAGEDIGELMLGEYGKQLGKVVRNEVNFADVVYKEVYDAFRHVAHGKGFQNSTTAFKGRLESMLEHPDYRALLPKLRPLLRGKPMTDEAREAAILRAFEDLSFSDPAQVALSDDAAKEMIGAIPDKLPIENSELILRVLNRYKNNPRTPQGVKRAAGELYEQLRPSFDKALPGNAQEAFANANATMARIKDRLNRKVVDKLVKDMAENPSKAIATVLGSGVESKTTVDNLRALQRVFTEGVDVETTLGKRAFEEKVLQPLRYHHIFRAVDPDSKIVSGKVLKRELDGMTKEYRNLLFGEESATRLRELAGVLDMLQRQPGGSSMFIRMAQGGVAASAAYDVVFGKGIRAGTAWIGSILTLGPAMLSRVVSNPRRIEMLVEGFKGGMKSTAGQRMIGMLMFLKGKERVLTKGWSEGETDFYTNPETQQKLRMSTMGE